MKSIKDIIGEATDYDKKQALESKRPKSWLKSVSAFANGTGGTLIFGIADDESIVGLQDAKHDAEMISECIHARIDPQPIVNLKFEAVNDKTLLLLEVEAGHQTPYYYIGDGNRLAFVRIGNQSVPAENHTLINLILKGHSQTYDILPSGYDFEKMAFTKLRSICNFRIHRDFLPSDFESWGLVDENGCLTNAGALLADECPLRRSRVFCTRWDGLTMTDALDSAEYSGSLLSLLQETMGFIKRHMANSWRKLPEYREDFPDYPERTIQEVTVNSLIHRSYIELGSEVHVDIYDDRIEVYSPGGMYGGGNIQDYDILYVPSRRRNPILADIFNRLDYMERRGSGFKKIIGDYAALDKFTHGLRPTFRSEFDAFFITLPNVNYYLRQIGYWKAPKDVVENVVEKSKEIAVNQDTPHSGENDAVVENVVVNLTARHMQILNRLRLDSSSSASDIAKALSVTPRTVQRDLQFLQEKAIIRRIGPDKGGSWEIMASIE